jgi:hypothetical protein
MIEIYQLLGNFSLLNKDKQYTNETCWVKLRI